MKVEEFKLKIHQIKFWDLVFESDIWIWISDASNVVNFTKDYIKDYCNNIILFVILLVDESNWPIMKKKKKKKKKN
jgi:hypothetical protein